MANTNRKSQGIDDVSSNYRFENDPRFRRRIEAARASLRAGRGVRLEDVGAE
jgi:hypothetical protein